MRENVLVTDGDQRAALACVRALGAAGHRCFVLAPRKGSLAAVSRHCHGSAAVPDPREDPKRFLGGVRERLDAWGCGALLPITEGSLRAVLPERGTLPDVLLPFPPAEVFARVSDKAAVLGAATEVGITVPRQWELRDATAPEALTADPWPGALVVKPTRSVARAGTTALPHAVSYVHTLPELRAHLTALPPGAFPVLVQERIHGTGAGVFLLLWDGEPRAMVGHRRLREKPPSGGVSVVRESTVVEPGLLDRSLQLLDRLGWRDGVAMVEFKIQEATGTPYLMEINGRFWGSLQLAVDAGVDFPSLLLRCARGEPPASPVLGRAGVTTRWLMGDVDQLLVRLRRSRRTLALPPSAPGRLRSIWEFLRDFRPGVRNEVLRMSDPRPFLTELGNWMRRR